MKSMHWPKEGLPVGTTREQFEVRYGEYPFNEMGKMSQYADADGFAVAEAPTGFMVIKRHVRAGFENLNSRLSGFSA